MADIRHVRPERRAAAAGYVSMSKNDTKLEAKPHFFGMGGFIGLEF